MNKILHTCISLFLVPSILVAQENNQQNVADSTKQEPVVAVQNEEMPVISSESGLVIPQFSIDYLHGKIVNQHGIKDINGSNYIQLSATMNTGTQEGSFFNFYKKPQVGFSFLVGWPGKRETLGTVLALYPTWRYTFFESKTIGANIKLGSGFAWFTKPYDKIDNPENTLVGSHLSNATEFGLSVWFKFHPQWKVEAGTSLLHFSNGHTAIPNYGLNDITARIGAIYEPGTLTGTKTFGRRLPSMDTYWRKTIMLSVGRHELAFSTFPTDGPSYNIYKVTGYVSKQLTNINEIQFGVSASYYESYYEFIHLTDYYDHLQRGGAMQVAVHIGHEFLINRFGLLTDLGVKVLDPFYRSYMLDRDESLWFKSIFAPKIGFKFYPIWNSFAKQKLALGMYINTNGTQADYVEYSLSYTF